MPRMDGEPEFYVLNCARLYAETMRKLQVAANADERRRHTSMLHYLMDSGQIEQKVERERRERRLPSEIMDHIEKRQLLPADYLLNRDDAELVRQVYSVPPFATVDNLSGEDMLNLADMYEGWALDGRLGGFDIARLLGWADGFRALVVTIGADFEPPAMAPGEPDSLLKFLTKKMKQQSA